MVAQQKGSSSSSSSSSLSSSWFSNLCSSASRAKTLSPSSSASDTYGCAASGETLVRRLTVFDLLLLGIGASVGAGIFVVTGTVAQDAGPGVTVSFIIAGVASVLSALCYAECASRFPGVVGGAYLYAYTAFNELTAFLVFGQQMFDFHIGTATIARSLASYLVSILEIFPFFNGRVPSWVGHGGQDFLGGAMSINILSPILLVLVTIVLCRGVGESAVVNSVMTITKIVIIIIVIVVGSFEVDISNWSPFAPNGVKAIVTGATVAFFAYVGFDAVANSAEEAKNPQRDLPISILGSLAICMLLYIGVCLVVTGMVPYSQLDEESPLAEAFKSKSLIFVSILISIGAIAGLTTSLLVSLYAQARIYLGLGRDGLLPAVFANVNSTYHTPVDSQIWVGVVSGVMAGLFNVHILSRILSVGTLLGYSVVSASVVTLRLQDEGSNEVSKNWLSSWKECVICLGIIASGGFFTGLCYRFSFSLILLLGAILIAILAIIALYYRQVYAYPTGFACPWVPLLPSICIFFNIFLFAQLHHEAWIRFIILSIISIGIYSFYGQYHTVSVSSHQTTTYHRAPSEEDYVDINCKSDMYTS